MKSLYHTLHIVRPEARWTDSIPSFWCATTTWDPPTKVEYDLLW